MHRGSVIRRTIVAAATGVASIIVVCILTFLCSIWKFGQGSSQQSMFATSSGEYVLIGTEETLGLTWVWRLGVAQERSVWDAWAALGVPITRPVWYSDAMSRHHAILTAGWPFRTAWCMHTFEPDEVSGGVIFKFGNRESTVPLRPIWTGLLLNVALFAMLISIGRLGLRRIRRTVRRRKGDCVRCGYDRRLASSDHCPECGNMEMSRQTP
jgi:hypothetical protein